MSTSATEDVAKKPRIAITLGDPRGVGPEVVTLALTDRGLRDAASYVVFGPDGVARPQGLEFVSVGAWRNGDTARQAGWLAGRAIEAAARRALEGAADGIVTAPIHKAAFREAGYAWPGHTEMLRDLAGVAVASLCLAAEDTRLGGPLRVVLVTGHIALREVPSAYTVARVVETALAARDGLRLWWGLPQPRLALCGLNPHASDSGLFGDEESRICYPAMSELRSMGVDISGPFPADTVFLRAAAGEADAVLAPYHDVGMAAIKTAAFGQAVNITLGLPFLRTSPDHGTAFDIAGTGRADPSSMAHAIATAARLVRHALTRRRDGGKLASPWSS